MTIDDVWKKMPKTFYLLNSEQCQKLGLNPSQLTRVYQYENEIAVFNVYEEGNEFVQVYDKQMDAINKKVKGIKDWNKISPIKPIYYKWADIKNKKVYFSIFESYNTLNKLSLQMFVEIENGCLGISVGIKRKDSLSFEDILSEPLIKNILKVII